jgi:hypothetical protein
MTVVLLFGGLLFGGLLFGGLFFWSSGFNEL